MKGFFAERRGREEGRETRREFSMLSECLQKWEGEKTKKTLCVLVPSPFLPLPPNDTGV